MVYALCVLAVAAVSVKLAATLGPVVRCEPCDARALAQCKPLQGDCQPVRESGCGCCMTCALRQGQPCGVYTERCAAGFTCLPQTGESRPLQALLEGRGLCTNRTAKLRVLAAAGNANRSEEERNASNSGNEWSPNTHRMQESKTHQQHNKLLRKEASKKSQLYKINNEAANTETTNFSSEIKHDTEYGPCRREIEDILNNLKAVSVLSPRGVYIPNCDKKGFYKKKTVSIF
ncbi:insulin-like growth factor-binding protein 3 isoform X2 [Scyliorhinus canicula]|uniref:insulin-like growth factor-binding protein 3 isoform X2 n=1 Tax=Scyliorhinus canicula TaxID=7830 RepID=UPI0018F3D32F|nr:insulin-like growth factor-binding protein 3 isoform X2 [Scyliorhinus canicula]